MIHVVMDRGRDTSGRTARLKPYPKAIRVKNAQEVFFRAALFFQFSCLSSRIAESNTVHTVTYTAIEGEMSQAERNGTVCQLHTASREKLAVERSCS